MHLFQRRSVYKHLCTVKVRQGFSERKFVLSILLAPLRASIISTLVLSVKGLEGSFMEGRGWVLTVLSHNHCTIESHRLFKIPSLRPPSVSSLAVRSSSLMLRLSRCPSMALKSRAQQKRLPSAGETSPSRQVNHLLWWSCGAHAGAWATRLPLKRWAVVSSPTAGAAAVMPCCHCVSRPLSSAVWGWGFGRTGSDHISRKNVSTLIKFCSRIFCLIYSCIKLCFRLWCRRAVRQLRERSRCVLVVGRLYLVVDTGED